MRRLTEDIQTGKWHPYTFRSRRTVGVSGRMMHNVQHLPVKKQNKTDV